jgi:Fe2+ or Zn2+ uptake regulation protein
MSADGSDEVRSIAEEIERYLARHPNAADSADGIHRWWLPTRSSEKPLESVEAALELLVGRGVVSKTVLEGGRVIYSGTSRRAGPTH